MDKDSLAQLRAEQERILAMPGRIAWAKIALLSRPGKIFVGNAETLLEHLGRMHDPEQLMATWPDPQASERFLEETERHLHNYVAAAHSRVEHVRQFVRAEWPEDSPQRREYQGRVDDECKTSPLHNFVINLRNYILHVRLPLSTEALSWQRGGPLVYQALLDSADLLQWDRWSTHARQYIRESGESVDLAGTVRTYTAKMMTFDRWVAERFTEAHLDEIESFLAEVSQHQARLRRLGLSHDPEQ
jgi:hypothetical protein